MAGLFDPSMYFHGSTDFPQFAYFRASSSARVILCPVPRSLGRPTLLLCKLCPVVLRRYLDKAFASVAFSRWSPSPQFRMASDGLGVHNLDTAGCLSHLEGQAPLGGLWLSESPPACRMFLRFFSVLRCGAASPEPFVFVAVLSVPSPFEPKNVLARAPSPSPSPSLSFSSF